MKYILYLGFILLFACNAKKQEAGEGKFPFWNDIQKFKNQDSISPPPQHAILFIGSSSFTLWRDVQDYFHGYTIINRGFGSSTLVDQIRYVNDIVFPYNPRQIVIYCGENDLAFSDTVTSTTVFERFKKLYGLIREKTNAPIAYISMKPSPSRRHLIPKMREANMLIQEFISQQDKSAALRSDLVPSTAVYIDVHWKMLNKEGQPMPEIFLKDSLHMNAKGYAIWQREITPYLLRDQNETK